MMLLLHLSDIHFRHDEVGTAMDPNGHLRNEILLDAESMCLRLGCAPSSILISGDVAYAGHPDEYAFAQDWLQDLCTKCGTTLASVFIIPGNHDAVQSITSRPVIQSLHRDIKSATSSVALEGVLRGLLTDTDSRRLLYESLDNYNLFSSQFFCALLPPNHSVATRDLTLNDGSTLRLSGLNSTFVSSEADKPGDLFIDPACLQLSRARGVEHLVMCHHPYSWLRQGDELRDHLHSVARIHLFGHEHMNRVDLGRDWIRIDAGAAHPDRSEQSWEPGYNLIELEVLGAGVSRQLAVRAHIRVWQQRPGQFRAKMDGESDVFQQTIRLDAWVTSTAAEEGRVSSPDTAAIGRADGTPALEPARSEPMDTLRDVSVRFFRLTLSQKAAIAGKLNLLEEEDINQPDFERFRRVLIRARDRGLVNELDREVSMVIGLRASEGERS
jgi:hypothetical protein